MSAPPPSAPPASELARHWTLDPGVVFLNHGSYGACPREVLDEQARLRERIERQPVQFFARELEALMDAARAELAAFVGAAAEDLVPVANVTMGINAVLRSLPLAAGDELLVSNHEYNASRNALDFVAARARARVVVAEIPFPVRSPEQVVEVLLAKVGPRTRLALVDHVTSQTGLVLPIARIVAELEARGVDTLVDGAHAPGMVELDVAAIGAAWYTGNCHKWICAPKGAGFLVARADRQVGLRPTCISHGANSPRNDRSRYQVEFGWTGTDDPTAFLSVPSALRVIGSLLPGGWPEVRARNHALALAARRIVCDALGVAEPAPAGMLGTLASVPLPDGSPEPPASPLYLDPLQQALYREHRIEIPVIPWPAPPRRLIRLSAQLYNFEAQYRALAAALPGLLAAERG